MFDSPIVLYSARCAHSQEFLEIVKSRPERIVAISVDKDPATGGKPQAYFDVQNVLEWKVKRVPTVITTQGDIVSGTNAFVWAQTPSSQAPSAQMSAARSNDTDGDPRVLSSKSDCEAVFQRAMEARNVTSQSEVDKKRAEEEFAKFMNEGC